MGEKIKQKAESHQTLMNRIRDLKKKKGNQAATDLQEQHVPADGNSAENKQVDYICTPRIDRVHKKPQTFVQSHSEWEKMDIFCLSATEDF